MPDCSRSSRRASRGWTTNRLHARVVVAALRSDKFHHILAGFLVESDVPWTPDVAEQNAKFFAEIS
jgi:hypothetical protein